LIAKLKAIGINVAVCATTGIAAQLLREGTTVHRRFGPIPSPLKPDSAIFLDANDPRIELFYHADVIIIDECSGMHVVSIINVYIF
jgi:hypothetical protein